MKDNPSFLFSANPATSLHCVGNSQIRWPHNSDSLEFVNSEGVHVAKFSWSGDKVTFTGNADEAALLFITIARHQYLARVRELEDTLRKVRGYVQAVNEKVMGADYRSYTLELIDKALA